MSQNPWKIKNIILVQWSTHNKVVLKAWQYWISEEHALLDIIVSSSASFNICWLSDFSLSENWLDLPDPQSILSSSNSLFLLFTIGISTKGVLNFFAFFLVIKATVRPESLLSLIFWCFSSLFGDSLGPSDSISLYFLLFHGSRLQIQNVWEVYITNSKFSSF